MLTAVSVARDCGMVGPSHKVCHYVTHLNDTSRSLLSFCGVSMTASLQGDVLQ